MIFLSFVRQAWFEVGCCSENVKMAILISLHSQLDGSKTTKNLINTCTDLSVVNLIFSSTLCMWRSWVGRFRPDREEDGCTVRGCGTDAGQSVSYFTLRLKPKPFSEKT